VDAATLATLAAGLLPLCGTICLPGCTILQLQLQLQLRVLGTMPYALLLSSQKVGGAIILQLELSVSIHPWHAAVHCIQCSGAHPMLALPEWPCCQHVLQHAAVPVHVAHGVLVCE
jgi:hypothetical protein